MTTIAAVLYLLIIAACLGAILLPVCLWQDRQLDHADQHAAEVDADNQRLYAELAELTEVNHAAGRHARQAHAEAGVLRDWIGANCGYFTVPRQRIGGDH